MLMTVATAAIASGGCTSSPEATDNADAPSGETTEELQVVTTFLPITQFTNAVAGDRAEVTQLLPANVGPHDYQAKPTDVQAIANADVLVQNGLEFEFFLEDLIENAENEDLAIVDSSTGIATIASEEEKHDDHEGHDDREGHDHEGHDHEEHDHEEHDHEGHDDRDHEKHDDHEKHGGGHHHHHHGEFDPHIWLDPKRAIAQVENIRDGLIAADPEGEEEYTANAAAFIEQLQALDAEITEKLEPYRGQVFISFHDFARYFAESYNLKSESLVGIPEENASPKDVQRIIETVETENLKALLTEPQASQNSFDSIAKDLQVEVSVFDPLETGDIDSTDSESYITIMRQNAENLAEAFGD
ncbi:MAG: zinc ABC transporter substrate-binding protein [Cyanobacteria bacterium P01_E01_bin.42]